MYTSFLYKIKLNKCYVYTGRNKKYSLKCTCTFLQEFLNNYNLDFGIFFLVAANTVVNFIPRFIFPLIFNLPFINACWGFNSPVINFDMLEDSTVTIKSGFFPSPLLTTGSSLFKSRKKLSFVSDILKTTLPY